MSSAMQTYLVKRSLITPPVKVPDNIKHFYEQFNKQSPSSNKKNSNHTEWKTIEKNLDEESTDKLNIPENIRFVMSNYVLLKNIFSNFDSWQELTLLSTVCKMWAEVVNNLTCRDLAPRYFFLQTKKSPFELQQNAEFNVKPMYFLIFATKAGMKVKCPCDVFPTRLCSEDCKDTHKILDYLNVRTCYPKKILVAHECIKIIYRPPPSVFPHQIKNNGKPLFNLEKDPCMTGLYIPQIPGVSVKTVKISTKHDSLEVQADFAARIVEMLDYKVVKCILMFSRDVDDVDMLDILMKVSSTQGESIPLAIGGCSIERSCMEDFNHTQSHRSHETVFTFFMVDKETEEQAEFDVYSRVLTQSHIVESDLILEMKKLSDAIPRREYSAALKLSCVGRHSAADRLEDSLFQKHFPSTSLMGCYGQGELGVDSVGGKLRRGPLGFAHQYSTVFVIFMWGKLL